MNGQKGTRQSLRLESFERVNDLRDYKAGDLVKEAQKIANQLRITTSQLRKIHGYIVKIWERYRMDKAKKEENFEEIKERLELLKPRLYYNAARIGGRASDQYRQLADILSSAIDKVNDTKGFEKFKEFYDAIVAYSKQK